jgi:hypothetical protein
VYAHAEQRGPGLWDEVCSPKMQWWSLLALADLFVINRPHTLLVLAGSRGGPRRRSGCRREASCPASVRTMSRQSTDTISSNWSHGEEGRESGLAIPRSLQFIVCVGGLLQTVHSVGERGFCLLKGIAEGTYNTKHAEAARLYYTTILLCYYTTTLLLLSSLRELGRGGDPGAEAGDQGWSDARGAGRRAPVLVIIAGGDERRGRRAVRWRRGQARHQLVRPRAIRGREGLKQLQFVLPAGEELPSEHLVGAGREQGGTRPEVRLSVQSQLSVERKAMMSRQLVGARQTVITATRSRVEEGRELRPNSVEGPHFLSIIVPASISHGTKHPFEASKHGEQAGSICGRFIVGSHGFFYVSTFYHRIIISFLYVSTFYHSTSYCAHLVATKLTTFRTFEKGSNF